MKAEAAVTSGRAVGIPLTSEPNSTRLVRLAAIVGVALAIIFVADLLFGPRTGLRVRYFDASQPDGVDRLLILERTEPIRPLQEFKDLKEDRLPEKFQALYSGWVRIKRPGRYYFQFGGRGSVEVRIDGAPYDEPRDLDRLINVTDALEVLRACSGLPYRFVPPRAADPCE